MKSQSQPVPEVIHIDRVDRRTIPLCVLGRSPFLFNRVPEKAKRELLGGGHRKTKAEKAMTVKHDPVAEYRSSVYRFSEPEAPTLLGFRAAAFKAAMMTAALEIPNVNKTTIQRLVLVEEELVPFWGVPRLYMDIVRSAGIQRTPDVRTWAMLPEWAAIVKVSYVSPQLNDTAIVNLMYSAGDFIGVGDGRNEKGKKAFGQFTVVSPEEPAFARILREGSRSAQIAALDDPVPYDEGTRELIDTFFADVTRLGRHDQVTPRAA